MRHNHAATLLMTRPEMSSHRFITQLAKRGVVLEYCISPALSIVPVTHDIDLSSYDAVIFTSQNGVAHGPHGAGRLAYCVGDQTAEAARTKGYEVLSADGAADDLIDLLARHAPDHSLIHIRGTHSRGRIAQSLQNMGVPCEEVIAYDQIDRPLSPEAQSLLAGGKPVILPLFSPRSAAIVGQQVQLGQHHHIIALSDAVSQAFGALQSASVQVADKPTLEAMIDGVKAVIAT